MKYILFEFKKGMEILVDRRYTSFVVDTIIDTEDDATENRLVIFKDWNPERKCWDYHVMNELSLSFTMDLYKREFLADFKNKLSRDEKKRISNIAVPGPDKKKVVLDEEHLKEMFKKYKIIKKLEE